MSSWIQGFDYSHYQQTIDWQNVTGQAFAIGKVTQGTTFVDPLFAQNASGIRATNILPGWYHFANGEDPVTEANFFLNTLGTPQENEFLVLDFERQGIANPDQWCAAFVNTVHDKLGVWPLVYAPRSIMPTILPGIPNCGLWLSDPNDSPNSNALYNGKVVSYTYVMHQYGENHISGIASGPVDVDAFFGTRQQLEAYGYHEPAIEVPPVVEPSTTTEVSQSTTVVTPTESTATETTVVATPSTPATQAQPITVQTVAQVTTTRTHVWDVVVRSVKTFGATFVATLTGSGLNVAHLSISRQMVVSALAGGITAVLNSVIKFYEATR